VTEKPTVVVVEPPPVAKEESNPSASEEKVDEESAPLHIRRKNIPKHVRTMVWNVHMGISNLEAKCFSCRAEKVDARNFQCGHVIAESKGGDMTIKNLRPICQPCNASMGTQSMNEFTKEYFGWEV
jgi:5-methylcytosine-specific restriction endonuclease McrA